MDSSPDQVPDQVVDKSEISQDQVTNKSSSSQSQVPTRSRKSPSGDSGKITKPKNPGRVAAGKKLAEMNKKNKEKKTSPIQTDDPERSDINWGYVIGGAGLVLAGGSLYYAYKEHQRATESTTTLSRSERSVKAAEPPKKKLMEME